MGAVWHDQLVRGADPARRMGHTEGIPATIVFLAVDEPFVRDLATREWRSLPNLRGERVLLDLAIIPAAARACDIECGRGGKGYLLMAALNSSWLNQFHKNVVADGEIIQVGAPLDGVNQNTIGLWRSIAEYVDGKPLARTEEVD